MPKSKKQKREGALYRLEHPTPTATVTRQKKHPRTEAQKAAEIERLRQLINRSK